MRVSLIYALLAALWIALVPHQARAQEEIPAIDGAKLAVARQIIDRGFPEDSREAIFLASMDQMMLQTREASLTAYKIDDPGAIALLDSWIADYTEDAKIILRSHIPALMDAMAKSYAVMFTMQELEDINAFVATDSGQRFFELSSAVLAERNFAAANQMYMDEIQATMPAAINDLVGRLREYFAQQEAEDVQSSS